MAKLVAILGSVTPPGRMLNAITWTIEASRAVHGLQTALINLADYRIAFADGRPPEQYGDDTASLLARIQQADVILMASPVYRGTFTGALKNLLDHLPIEALAGKPIGWLWALQPITIWVSIGICAMCWRGSEQSSRQLVSTYRRRTSSRAISQTMRNVI